MFQKALQSRAPHSCCLVAEEKSWWAEVRSRLLAYTLFPFPPNPQKTHFGTSPTKTSPIALSGAREERVREWLCNLGHHFHQGMCILRTLQDSGDWRTPRKPSRVRVFQDHLWLRVAVLKVPFFEHSPWDLCISPLVLPFKRRCQVIKLNKARVTRTFSSRDQTSQLALASWHNLTPPEIKRRREESQLHGPLKRTTKLDLYFKRSVRPTTQEEQKKNNDNHFSSSCPSAVRAVTFKKRKKIREQTTDTRDSQKWQHLLLLSPHTANETHSLQRTGEHRNTTSWIEVTILASAKSPIEVFRH